MARGAPSGQHAHLVAAIEPVVAAAGYDLEDLSVTQAGRRSLVRVVVDGDGGVSLDDIAAVSRDISSALDDDNADAAVGRLPYTLEVTSPGVDRPLTLPRHWRRNVGRLVTVTANGESVSGRITATTDGGVILDVGGADREYGYPDLGPGRVQVEFARPGPTESIDEGDEDL